MFPFAPCTLRDDSEGILDLGLQRAIRSTFVEHLSKPVSILISDL